jgi:hypothetical protein
MVPGQLVVLEIPNCIVPLQVKFQELSGTEKKALHESKAKDITIHGMSLPSLWMSLQLLDLMITFFFASKFALFATVYHFFATPPYIFATPPLFFRH